MQRVVVQSAAALPLIVMQSCNDATMHQCNMQGTVATSTPVDEVALLFNSSALGLFHESDTIKYQVKFTGMAQSDSRVPVTFTKHLKVLVHVRALPSFKKSLLSLIIGDNKPYSGGDILEGSAVAVHIDTRDEEGESISDKSKISPIVTWTQNGGPEKKFPLRYREGHFYAQLLTHATPGSYTLWVSAVDVELEMGSKKYIPQSNVPGGVWKCGLRQELPTSQRSCSVHKYIYL